MAYQSLQKPEGERYRRIDVTTRIRCDSVYKHRDPETKGNRDTKRKGVVTNIVLIKGVQRLGGTSGATSNPDKERHGVELGKNGTILNEIQEFRETSPSRMLGVVS